MKLYHGSTVEVRKPSLRYGRERTDFGKGFYTTTNPEQADRWAHIKQEREEAPRANDRVFTTVNLFESGDLSAEAAILQLKAY